MTLRTYKRPKQQSTKAKAIEALLDEARPRVWKRAEYRCELMISPECSGRAEDLHHTKMRSGGWSPDECHADEALRASCRDCHLYVHGHPAEAQERGLIVRKYA